MGRHCCLWEASPALRVFPDTVTSLVSTMGSLKAATVLVCLALLLHTSVLGQQLEQQEPKQAPSLPAAEVASKGPDGLAGSGGTGSSGGAAGRSARSLLQPGRRVDYQADAGAGLWCFGCLSACTKKQGTAAITVQG